MCPEARSQASRGFPRRHAPRLGCVQIRLLHELVYASGEWGTPLLSGTCPSCCRPCWTSCQTKVSGLRLRLSPRRGNSAVLVLARWHQLGMGWAVSPALPSSGPLLPERLSHCPCCCPLSLRLAYGMASLRLCPCLIKHKHQSVTFTWRAHDSQELCSVSFQMTMWYPAPRWDTGRAPMPLCTLWSLLPSRAASF